MDHFAKKATKIAKAMYQAARDPDQYQQGVQHPQHYGQTQQTSQHMPMQKNVTQQYQLASPSAYASSPAIAQSPLPAVNAYAAPVTSTAAMTSSTSTITNASAHDTYPSVPIPNSYNYHPGGGVAAQPLVGSVALNSSSPAPGQAATPMSVATGMSPQHTNTQGYFAPHSTASTSATSHGVGYSLPPVNNSATSLPSISQHSGQSQVNLNYPSPLSTQESGVVASVSPPPQHHYQQGYSATVPATQTAMFYSSTPHSNSQSATQFNANATPPFPGSVPPPPPYSHGPPKPLGHMSFVAELPAEPLIELSGDSAQHCNTAPPTMAAPQQQPAATRAEDLQSHSKAGYQSSSNMPSPPKQTSAQAYTHLPEIVGPSSPQPLLTATAETSLQKLEQPKPVHPEQTAKATAEQIASITPISPVPAAAQLPSQHSISSMLAGKPLPGPPPMGPPPNSAPIHNQTGQLVPQFSQAYQGSMPVPISQPIGQHQLQPLPPPPPLPLLPQQPLQMQQPSQMQYHYNAPPPPLAMATAVAAVPSLPLRDQYGNVLPPLQNVLPPVYNMPPNAYPPSHQQQHLPNPQNQHQHPYQSQQQPYQ